MKTKINLFLILFALIFFTGCNKDFLNLSPPSSLTGDTFFRNQADADAVVTAAYKGLTNTGDYAKSTEAPLTDIVIFNTQGLNLDSWSIDATESTTDNVWQTAYEGVFRANIILKEVPKINITKAIQDRMLGEGHFLRAFYYWQLTTYFGDVPIVTDADAADPSKSAVARSPIADVYKLMIDDLTTAITQLPATYAAADVGRATKGAAQALLGKVYLYAKNYTLAESTFKSIIDGNLYSLLPNFQDLLIKDNNAESLFEVQFADVAGQGTSRITNDYPQGQGGFANLLPTQILVDQYETYTGPGNINGRDPRLFYSIWRDGDPYDATAPVFKSNMTPTGYSRKKGMFPVIRTNNSNLGINFPLIRYADVLLMYAEAANENNKPVEAVASINKVRARVGMPALPTAQYPTGTKAQIFAAIVHERRVELAFEYHELNDLRRWDLAQSVLGSVGYTSPKNKYFPIPLQEIQTNPKLTQNTGY